MTIVEIFFLSIFGLHICISMYVIICPVINWSMYYSLICDFVSYSFFRFLTFPSSYLFTNLLIHYVLVCFAWLRRSTQTLLGCGLAYYLYNEMGFRVLNRLDPVSAAVGNTVKWGRRQHRERIYSHDLVKSSRFCVNPLGAYDPQISCAWLVYYLVVTQQARRLPVLALHWIQEINTPIGKKVPPIWIWDTYTTQLSRAG